MSTAELLETRFDHIGQENTCRHGGETGPVVLVSTVTPKPGKTLELIYEEISALYRLAGEAGEPGFLSNRVYRALDDRTAVMVSVFETAWHHQRWLKSDFYKEQARRLERLADLVEPGCYELVFQEGA